MNNEKLQRGQQLVVEIQQCEEFLLQLNHWGIDGYPCFTVHVVIGSKAFALPDSVVPAIKAAYEKSLAHYKKEFDEL